MKFQSKTPNQKRRRLNYPRVVATMVIAMCLIATSVGFIIDKAPSIVMSIFNTLAPYGYYAGLIVAGIVFVATFAFEFIRYQFNTHNRMKMQSKQRVSAHLPTKPESTSNVTSEAVVNQLQAKNNASSDKAPQN